MGRNLSKVLMSLAAVLSLGVLSYNVYVNSILSSQMEDLQGESAVLTRWEKLPAQESQVMDHLDELRSARDFLAKTERFSKFLAAPKRSKRITSEVGFV